MAQDAGLAKNMSLKKKAKPAWVLCKKKKTSFMLKNSGSIGENAFLGEIIQFSF